MRKFIEADKLIAEINGIIAGVKVKKHPDEFGSIEQCLAAAEIEALNLTLDCIKELQQEQPEVDIAKEIEEYFKGWFVDEDLGLVKSDSWSCIVKDVKEVARHFYELGLKAKKEE